MTDDPVIFERYSEEVTACILNRPEKRNALSIELMQRLCVFSEQIHGDAKTRIWILRGKGSAFCSGLDFNEVMHPELGVESAKMVKQCLLAIHQAPVMTIAMVHGAARGGGGGLVAACDFAVADAAATIGFPEVRRGLMPAQVMSLLVRKLKGSDVKELLLSGEPVDAYRGLQMGLFHRVGNMETETEKLVSQLLQAAPEALARTKKLIDTLYFRRLQDDIETCMQHHMRARAGAEAQEGIRAFLAKRNPAWQRSRKVTL